MNKTLSKAFMYRSRLKNSFNKNPSEANKANYKKQRNCCVSLLKREKKKYYNKLDVTIFDNNKTFWRRIKPLFSDKEKTLPKEIILDENGTVLHDRERVANKLNDFFVDAVAKLEIEPFIPTYTDSNTNETIEDIKEKYKSHPSIIKIKENVSDHCTFSFTDTTPLNLQNEIALLGLNKTSVDDDIPGKTLKTCSEISAKCLCDIFNESKNLQDFPSALKLANVIPIHKKEEKTLSKNYRPVSLLPVVSKRFEKIIYKQINSYIEKFLSPYLFGFRKGHSTEQCLLNMLETRKKAADVKKNAAVLF